MTTPLTESLAAGRFQLLEVLGVGGMATVYRAFDRRLQRFRAIKILAPALAQRESLRKRFLAEAQTMATLEESRVVRVFDMGEDEGRVYIVMELVEGGSLVDRVNAAGPLPPQLATQVALQIAESLHVAHLAGVIHRDIKPHNILLTRSGDIRITDFGIAQVHSDANDGLTRTGAVMGTWGFMAPEQRSNAKSVDARADVFSIGATLWAVMKADTPPELYAEEGAFADIPDTLAHVVRKATRYRREERYPTALALADALREVLTTLTPDPEFVPPLVLTRTLAPPADSGTIDPTDDQQETTRVGTMVPDLGPDPSLQLRRPRPPADPEATAVPPPAGRPSDSLDPEARAERSLPASRPPVSTSNAGGPPRPARPGAWLGLGIAGVLAFAAVGTMGVIAMVWHRGDTVESTAAPDAVPGPDATATQPGTAPAQPPAVPTVGPTPGTPDNGAPDDIATDKPPTDKAATGKLPVGTPPAGKPADAGSDAVRTPSQKPTTPDPAPAPAPTPNPDAEVRVAATTLQHTPPASMPPGGPLTLTAVGGTDWAIRVYYRPLTGGQYNDKVMVASGTRYAITIRDPALTDGVEYFIKAATPAGTLTDGAATHPHRVTAQ